jgi:hypothetical protein
MAMELNPLDGIIQFSSQAINVLNRIDEKDSQHPLIANSLVISGKVEDSSLAGESLQIEIRVENMLGGITSYQYTVSIDQEGNYKAVIPLFGLFEDVQSITLRAGNSSQTIDIPDPESFKGERINLDIPAGGEEASNLSSLAESLSKEENSGLHPLFTPPAGENEPLAPPPVGF